MQTDTFNSSNWGSAEYIPVTPSISWFPNCLLVSGASKLGVLFFFLCTEWFWQVLLFLTQTRVAVPRSGDFLHHHGRLHLVQKEFYSFSDTELNSDTVH